MSSIEDVKKDIREYLPRDISANKIIEKYIFVDEWEYLTHYKNYDTQMTTYPTTLFIVLLWRNSILRIIDLRSHNKRDSIIHLGEVRYYEHTKNKLLLDEICGLNIVYKLSFMKYLTEPMKQLSGNYGLGIMDNCEFTSIRLKNLGKNTIYNGELIFRYDPTNLDIIMAIGSNMQKNQWVEIIRYNNKSDLNRNVSFEGLIPDYDKFLGLKR
jgi:hypothetical protein